jgi:uncharacterized membrane protein
MVVDERIGAVEDSLRSVSATVTVHDVRIGVLEDQSDRVEELLLEIRDEVRAHRSRLDRLTEAAVNAIAVIAASVAGACDKVGHRLIVAVLVMLAALLLTALGVDVSGVLPWLGL